MTITRRIFCEAVGATFALADVGWFCKTMERKPLRVITYNIFGLTGWPADRGRTKKAVALGQMAQRMAMELALYEPDIIHFSESPKEELTREIAERLGMHHVRFPGAGHWPGTLLSKFEIVESQNVPMTGERPKELFTRHWGKAIVELPGMGPVIVHSAHLFPTADTTIRLQEIRTMIEAMRPDLDSGRSILLMGDLNHGPETEEHQLWLDAGLVDTFVKVGQGEGLTFRADIAQWRIDYVMAAGALAEKVVESRPLFEGAFRLAIDDKESFSLSDHIPQLAVFHLDE